MDIFTADNWSSLTDAERIEYCLNAGNKAASYAQAVSPELREIYDDISLQWYRLANEIEARQPHASGKRPDENRGC